MLLPLLLAASLYQASTSGPSTSAVLSCYPEKEVVLCYTTGGILALTAYVTPATSIADPLAADLALNAFGVAADLGSTDWAISQGCVEANPLLPRPEGRVAGKIALSAFRGGVAYFLRRAGKKRAADVFRYVGLGVDVLLSANNLKCGLDARKK